MVGDAAAGRTSDDAASDVGADASIDGGSLSDATRIEAGGAGGRTSGADATLPTPADYSPTGPYGVTKMLLNQGLGTVGGGSAALMPLGNSNNPRPRTTAYAPAPPSPAGSTGSSRAKVSCARFSWVPIADFVPMLTG